MSKPRIGFYWCASCGGCEEAVVDLAESLLDVLERVEIAFWPCAMDFKREDLEAMRPGQLAACFVNGAVRSSEQREMVALCREKAAALIAFGSCSHTGGVPGLANLYSRESILQCVYGNGVMSTVNPDEARPRPLSARPEGDIELPSWDDEVKTLDQVAPVDYYLPGCPPPVPLIVAAVTALVEGTLPPPGAVLAPDVALCHDCPRLESKPEEPFLQTFKRPHEILIDPEKCFLAQGLVCMGPATRSGCEHACIKGNMPCTGCLGPLSHEEDFGGAILSATAALAASNDPKEVDAALDGIPDPAGTFYRYSLPASLLFGRVGCHRHENGGE